MNRFLFLSCLLVAVVVVSGCVEQQPSGPHWTCPDGTIVYDPAGCGEGCPNDTKRCLDGTTVARNPAMNCEFDNCPKPQEQKLEASISVFTDRQSYGSDEDILITVDIESNKAVQDAEIRVWGITVEGTSRIESSQKVELKTGQNSFLFSEKTPYCTSGCGGIKPGKYAVKAALFVEGGQVAETETFIELTQG